MKFRLLALLTLLAGTAVPLSAEEIFLQGGKRLMAMIEAIDAKGTITVRLPGGRMTSAKLTEVTTITFRGRENQAVRAEAQEFHFVSGDRIKGQIVQLSNDRLLTETAAAGKLTIPLASLAGS